MPELFVPEAINIRDVVGTRVPCQYCNQNQSLNQIPRFGLFSLNLRMICVLGRDPMLHVHFIRFGF